MKYIATSIILAAVLALPGHATEPSITQTVSTTDIKFKSPANNTWYCGPSLKLSPGTWELSYRVIAYSSRQDTGTVDAITTLTTDPSRATNPEFTAVSRDNKGFRKIDTLSSSSIVTLPTTTTFYLCIEESSGSSWDSLQMLGASWSPTIIRAVSLP